MDECRQVELLTGDDRQTEATSLLDEFMVERHSEGDVAHMLRATSPRCMRLGLDFFSAPTLSRSTLAFPAFAVATNPYAQWGTERQQKEWLANMLCREPSGRSLHAGTPTLAQHFRPSQAWQSPEAIDSMLDAVVHAVTEEDDAVRILGKQHEAAAVVVKRVAKLLWHNDCTHAVPCKLFVYCAYQGFRMLLMQQAMRLPPTASARDLATSVLQRILDVTFLTDFDQPWHKLTANLHALSRVQDVKWGRDAAALCPLPWDTSSATLDSWQDELTQTERLHLVTPEEMGHYAEKCATREVQRMLSFALARFVNVFVAETVRNWSWEEMATRTTSEQDYMNVMQVITRS